MKIKKLLKKAKKVAKNKHFSDQKLFVRKTHWGGHIDSWVATDVEMIKYANDCPQNGDWLDENGLAEFNTIDEAVDYFAHDYSDHKYMGIDYIIYYLDCQMQEGNTYTPYANQIDNYLDQVSA